MPETIIFVDTFKIRAGKLEDFKQATKELVELVQSNEPQLLLYGVHLNNDGTQMTGVQMHTDSASIEKHFMVAGPHFGKVMECLERGGRWKCSAHQAITCVNRWSRWLVRWALPSPSAICSPDSLA